jgi:hypothetical protein
MTKAPHQPQPLSASAHLRAGRGPWRTDHCRACWLCEAGSWLIHHWVQTSHTGQTAHRLVVGPQWEELVGTACYSSLYPQLLSWSRIQLMDEWVDDKNINEEFWWQRGDTIQVCYMQMELYSASKEEKACDCCQLKIQFGNCTHSKR